MHLFIFLLTIFFMHQPPLMGGQIVTDGGYTRHLASAYGHFY